MKAQVVDLSMPAGSCEIECGLRSPTPLALDSWLQVEYKGCILPVEILESVTNTMTEFYDYKGYFQAYKLFLQQVSGVKFKVVTSAPLYINANDAVSQVCGAVGLSTTWNASNWRTTSLPFSSLVYPSASTVEGTYYYDGVTVYTLSQTDTAANIINGVISWSQQVLPMKINIIASGYNLTFVQRGRETSTLEVTQWVNDTITRSIIRPFFQGATQGTIGQFVPANNRMTSFSNATSGDAVSYAVAFDGDISYGNSRLHFSNGVLVEESWSDYAVSSGVVSYTKTYTYETINGEQYLHNKEETATIRAETIDVPSIFYMGQPATSAMIGSGKSVDRTYVTSVTDYTNIISDNDTDDAYSPAVYCSNEHTKEYSKVPYCSGVTGERASSESPWLFTPSTNDTTIKTNDCEISYVPIGMGYFGKSTTQTTVQVSLTNSVAAQMYTTSGDYIGDITCEFPEPTWVGFPTETIADQINDVHKAPIVTIVHNNPTEVVNGTPVAQASILNRTGFTQGKITTSSGYTIEPISKPINTESSLTQGNSTYSIDGSEKDFLNNIYTTLTNLNGQVLEVVTLDAITLEYNGAVYTNLPTFYNTILWCGNTYYINSLHAYKGATSEYVQITMERWFNNV